MYCNVTTALHLTQNVLQEIPLPQAGGVTLARRTGKSLCIADKEHYNIVDLEVASLFPILPLSQAFEPTMFVVKPSITVISANEFLILSWTGASTLGLFITGDGDPVRGTLEWPSHPEALCMSISVLGLDTIIFIPLLILTPTVL